MNRYIEMLNACGADGWEISDEKTEGWEFYFIGHRLDQNRAKKVEHIRLKVYKKSADGEYLGIATSDVSPTVSDAELEKTVKDLVYQASLVKNQPYKLNQPRDYQQIDSIVNPLAEEAENYINTMNGISETDTEFLNSFEIFVNRHESRLITSEGIDITENYPTSTVDLVVNARDDQREIELYRLYSLGACDPVQLKKDVEELLKFGKDRLHTEPTPNLEKAAMVLSTDAALEVYRYFLENMNAAYVVRGMSSFEIGKPIADSFTGDRITMKALRELPGSPCNFSCDEEGAPIQDLTLIAEGVPEHYTGNRMFSQYLGLEDSFNVSNWSVEGGSCSMSEIRNGECLEIVEFSDFQVDSMTGDIFGEIRLAYYHDREGNVRIVSGGSVSGSMADNIADMKMSAEMRCYANARIPCVTRLEHVIIAGAAK